MKNSLKLALTCVIGLSMAATSSASGGTWPVTNAQINTALNAVTRTSLTAPADAVAKGTAFNNVLTYLAPSGTATLQVLNTQENSGVIQASVTDSAIAGYGTGTSNVAANAYANYANTLVSDAVGPLNAVTVASAQNNTASVTANMSGLALNGGSGDTLAVASAYGNYAKTVVTGSEASPIGSVVLSNTQDNTGALNASMTGLMMTGGSGSVSASAEVYGNYAKSVVVGSASGASGVVGLSSTQVNSGSVAASLSNVAMNTSGSSANGTAMAYGNYANTAITGSAGSVSLGNAQSNTASVTATVSNVKISTGSFSGNSISAQAYGNYAVGGMTK